MKTISRYIMTLALLITAVGGAWADGEIVVTVTAADLQADKSNPFTKDGVTITCSDRMTGGLAFNELYEMSTTLGYFTKIEITNKFPEGISGINGVNGFSVNGSVATWTGKASSVGLGYNSVGPVVQFVFTIEPADPTVKVTTNKAENETTFTTASFEMPTSDVTAEYELVRDMSVSMTTKVGDGEDGYRIRIKKDGESFVPAEMTLQEMMGLYKVHDGIENQDLVFYGDGKVCDISIFAVDDQDQPTGDAIAFTALTPGRYVAIATAAQGTIYDGQTPASNIFVLYQGYELTVAKGEYATFYAAEALTTEENSGAELYTISSVSDTEAVLSDKLETAPAKTPLLVFNGGEEAKTFLLIPTAEPDLALTVADAFKGTLDAKEFSKDDMEAAVYYVCTGKAFAPVKSAGTIAANRCWLEISTAAPRNARKIVHGDATKITNTDRTDLTDGDLYDLNGRKVLNPTKKGIYIKNGRKVVVK